MPTLGQLCALLAPLAWSVAVILFRRSANASALSLNLFKNVFAFVLLSATLLVLRVPIPVDRPWQDWARLAVSGVLGLAIADTLLFSALRRIGAGRLAIVDTVYAPMVVLLSFVFLDERLGPSFFAGAAAVLAGVWVAGRGHPEGTSTVAETRSIAVGMALGATAILGTATGVVIAKPVLENAHLVEVTWTRLLFGIAGLLLWTAATGRGREAAESFRPSPLWRTLVPGAFFGAYLSLMLWLGGFKWADASVAAVLNQMATVYLLILARVVLGEDIRARQVAGGLVAALGALWIVQSS